MKKGKQKEIINYQGLVAIDPDNLDEEIFAQPGLYMKFSERYSKKEKKKEELKNQIEIIRAELDLKIRTAPEKFGLKSLKSITEAVIKNTIERQQIIQEINLKIIKLNYSLNLIKAAITALDHKRKMLEKTVDLYNGQYFSPMKSPHPIKGGKRIYYAAINQQMNKELNRKR